jgi:carbon monoxide dehydrogenase subunit G
VELKGQRQLAADRATAWNALNDIEMLKLCVPGCESFAAVGENRYEVVMNTAIGPVKSRFKGTVELADIDAPNGYTMKFDSSGGAAGFARGDVRVTLADAAAGATRLDYVANVHVGGKLAQVGSRLIDAAAGAMADKFFEAFDVRLRLRAAEQLAETTIHVDADLSKPMQPMQPVSFGFWSLLKAFLKRLFGRA